MIVKPVNINLRVKLPKKIKWGVAFNKNFDVQSFFSAIQLLTKSKVTSVYSNGFNEAKEIAEKYGVINYFNDINEFLKSDFDIVYLADNSKDFFENATFFINNHKNLLCEKPSAITYNQSLEIEKMISEKELNVIVNYSHRFNPLVIKAKELIEKQVIGKIHSISATYHIDFLPDKSSIYKSKLSGISVLRDLGHQMIDLLQYLGGEIIEVKSFADNLIYKNPQNDFLTASLKFKSNCYGNLSVSYLSKKSVNRIEMLGHNGAIIIENIFDKKKAPTLLTIDLLGEGRKKFRKKVNKTLTMLRNSQKLFLNNKKTTIPFSEVTKNIYLIEQIEKSI